MRGNRDYDKTVLSFTLTKAGGRESDPVSLTGREFSNLTKPKIGPKTKAQTEALALIAEFVRGGMGK